MKNYEDRIRSSILILQRKKKEEKIMDYFVKQNYGSVKVVESSDCKFGVVGNDGEIIVPFGKYGWIDTFDSGLCRVRSHDQLGYNRNIVAVITFDGRYFSGEKDLKQYYEEDAKAHPEKYAKWGIINEKGEEVLPCEYDEVWNFAGKNRYSTKVVKGGVKQDVYFCNLNPSLPQIGRRRHYHGEYLNDRYDRDDYYSDDDYNRDCWYAMTDGQYGDMEEGFDGDFDFLGY